MAALGGSGDKDGVVDEECVRSVCVVGAEPKEPAKMCIELFDQRKILGYGGFAVVREAARKDTGTVYALKITSKKKALEVSRGEPAHHSLYCELRALAHCKGSFIANMHWAFQDEVRDHCRHCRTTVPTNGHRHHDYCDNCQHPDKHRLYLVLDFGHFGDLRSIMTLTPTGRLSEEVARFYVCQVILALDVCHFNGVLHRDTKPENVVVDAQGYAKLTDFGVARMPANIEDCRSTSGTHGYMPPELFRQPHSHGPAADWFALGVTLHELVLGCKPYARLELVNDTCVMDGLHSALVPAFVRSDRPTLRARAADLSTHCQSFMEHMLHSNVTCRLGTSDRLHEIKAHPWLACMDWKALAAREVAVPMRLQCPVGLHTDADLRAAHTMLAKHPIPADKQDHFLHYKYRDAPYATDQAPIPVGEAVAGVCTTSASSATTHESVPSDSSGSPDRPGWVLVDGLRGQCANPTAALAAKLGLVDDGMLRLHTHMVIPTTEIGSGLGLGSGSGSGSGSGKCAATAAGAIASTTLHSNGRLGTWGHCQFKCDKKSATAIAGTGTDGTSGPDTNGPGTTRSGMNPLRANDDPGVSWDVLGSSSKSMVHSEDGTYDSASLGGDRDSDSDLDSVLGLSASMEETKAVVLLL